MAECPLLTPKRTLDGPCTILTRLLRAPRSNSTDRLMTYRNPLGFYLRFLQKAVMLIRPAPLAVALGSALGRGRVAIETPNGTFWINPLSQFGTILSHDGNYEP